MANAADDFALALQLQEKLYTETEDVVVAGINGDWAFGGYVNESRSTRGPGSAVNGASSLCDESWELIDPSPDAWALFIEFNKKYFWGKLTGVELRWSSKMTL